MWMVLAHSGDASALWAYTRLQARRPVDLVLVEDLEAPGTGWVHRVGTSGGSVEIRLADGRRVNSAGVDAVLNRVMVPPAGTAAAVAAPGDGEYARGEITAFTISWITALAATVVNTPSTQGLCGRWRPALAWRVLAARAGLPVVPLDLDSTRPDPDHGQLNGQAGTTVLTIDGALLHPAAPAAVRDGAARLAELSGTPLLGLRFAGTDPARSGWRLLDATPQPDLSVAGEAGIDALEGVLSR